MNQPAGWYPAQGDPPNTVRYWDGNQWIGGPTESSSSSEDRNPASAGRRLVARFLDGIIVYVFSMIFGPSVEFPEPESATMTEAETQAYVSEIIEAVTEALTSPAQALTLFLTFLWFFLWLKFTSATPGKHMLGVRVTKEGVNAPLSWQTAALRTCNFLPPVLLSLHIATLSLWLFLTLIIGLISLVFLFSDDRKRTVMDRIAKTVVVRKT